MISFTLLLTQGSKFSACSLGTEGQRKVTGQDERKEMNRRDKQEGITWNWRGKGEKKGHRIEGVG